MSDAMPREGARTAAEGEGGMPMTAVLEARGVNKRFDAVVAAADIHISVTAGERVSLIGSNGAGKTTFVNMITGYLKPDEGRITLDGRDITPLAPRAITRLGVARSFQIPQLYAELTVLDNMLVANACHDHRRLSFWQPARRSEAIERAEALLERFRLAEHRERRVAELPGGVRKLLDIAMALTAAPKLLLLDEPTSGVSAEEKFPMMETVMAALGEEAMTVLFVEHDMDIVERYASRVVAFYSGRIIADGVPGEALATDEVRRYVTGELLKE
jgi:branched-chain amino acid transport system ATP-binding protein